MPKVRDSKLDTPSARKRLAARRQPYYTRLAPGIALGYRRNESAGTWSVRVTAGGGQWLKRIAVADDIEAAAPPHVLTFDQACETARKLARGGDDAAAVDGRPATVDEALTAYGADLGLRGGDPYNADRARRHCSGVLLSKPVGLLTSDDMLRWRDELIAKGNAASGINRVRNTLRAALTLAARRDRLRIKNEYVWQDELEALPNATAARNIVLADDATTQRFIAAAYDHDPAVGLLVDVMAETGARPSQLVRITVADLDVAGPMPRLKVPRSGKGNPKARAEKMLERVTVAISPALGDKLRAAGKGRDPDAPLLLRSNGKPWGYRRSDQYRRAILKIVAALGLDEKTTLYSLRHTAITRQLLAGIPIRLVAVCADTSVREIERHYARAIDAHSDTDALMRQALPAAPRPRLVA